jgi:acyl carrier protein
MVQQRIKTVFAQVFQVDPDQIPPAASPAEIEAWDSFGHLALVEALQSEFGVEFEIEDIGRMDNLESIEDVLRQRGAGAS